MTRSLRDNLARLVRAGTVRRLTTVRSLLSRAGLQRSCVIATGLTFATFGSIPAHAAKNPDKPDKKIEKFERKLERAAAGDYPVKPEPRQSMAAPAPSAERSSRSDRSSKSDRGSSDRGDRSESPERSSPADPQFEGFRLIMDRNIFNPTRTPRTRAAPEEKPPRVDEISLVGTMRYDKGLVAFFDSPDAQFRKNLREGESIAGYKIGKIAADGVELVKDDKPVSLKVAQQLRRREGGEWTVSATVRTDGVSQAEALRLAAEAAATDIPADASDAYKRLIEKRKQQLSK
jgi:hypothetical protein